MYQHEHLAAVTSCKAGYHLLMNMATQPFPVLGTSMKHTGPCKPWATMPPAKIVTGF